MTVSRDRVIYTMREILRNQCTFSYMPREVVDYVFSNNLLKKTEWPAWLISLTPKGRMYLGCKSASSVRSDENNHP